MSDCELTPLRIAQLMSAAPPPRVAAILADLADLVASYAAADDGSEIQRILAEYRTLEAQLPAEWRPSGPKAAPPADDPRRSHHPRRRRLKSV